MNIHVQPAEIEFLGVWDTVPGSQFKDYFNMGKKYRACKQKNASTDTRQRYQLDSYPPIHHIVHAVANDEKRKEFSPLFLCSKVIEPDSVHNTKFTTLDEMLFPGAHADVGGGYGHKNNQLPDISLKWMAEKLNTPKHYPFMNDFINTLKPAPMGLADLSISKYIGVSKRYSCLDRTFPTNMISDDNVKIRQNAKNVPWVYYDFKPPKGDYSDRSCLGMVIPPHWKDSTDGSKEENVLCIDQSKLTCGDLGY